MKINKLVVARFLKLCRCRYASKQNVHNWCSLLAVVGALSLPRACLLQAGNEGRVPIQLVILRPSDEDARRISTDPTARSLLSLRSFASLRVKAPRNGSTGASVSQKFRSGRRRTGTQPTPPPDRGCRTDCHAANPGNGARGFPA